MFDFALFILTQTVIELTANLSNDERIVRSIEIKGQKAATGSI
jgi:hypothetical protein